jgi:hypothetical protein
VGSARGIVAKFPKEQTHMAPDLRVAPLRRLGGRPQRVERLPVTQALQQDHAEHVQCVHVAAIFEDRGAAKGFGTPQVIRVVLTQCLLVERNQVALNPSAALLVPPAAAARAR